MDFEKSSIERLKRTLYSRNEKIVPKEKRTPVAGQELDVPKDWGDTPNFGLEPEIVTTRNNSFFNKFLIGSSIFFVLALGAALFIFFGGINMISSNNLDIKITAPSSISSGEELSVGLSVVNSNRTDLEEVSLFVTYPDGAQSIDNSGKALTRDEVSLGTIASGATSDYTVRALLYGAKDDVRTFDFRLEYKVKGSNAVFSKEKTYDVIIGSSPIILNVNAPTEVNSGDTVNLSLDLTSNSATVVKNSLIKIEYPYGFTYKSSNITPIQNTSIGSTSGMQVNDSIWNIGDLKNSDKKTLSITGVLVGQDLEDRSFLISVGTPNVDNPTDIGTTLASNTVTIGIRKSFFGLTVTPDTSAIPVAGQPTPITINWENTLPDKINNSKITATISGNAFNHSAVVVNDGGFYQSVNSTVLWDQNSTSDLTTLSPGDAGTVGFTVGSFPDNAQTRSVKNPHIDISVSMTGDRSGASSGTVSSTANFTIKIPSTLSLSAQSFRTIGPFSNTGVVPPRADHEYDNLDSYKHDQ